MDRKKGTRVFASMLALAASSFVSLVFVPGWTAAGAAETFSVSGSVQTFAGDPIEEARISAQTIGPGGAASDWHAFSSAAGDYVLDLPAGFTGVVKCRKPDYVFDPLFYTLSDLQAPSDGLNFAGQSTAPPPTVIISGVVALADDSPLEGVVVVIVSVDPAMASEGASGGGAGFCITDAAGYYSLVVPSGFTGVIEPHKPGYDFDPASRSFDNLTADDPDANFAATPKIPPTPLAISGTVLAPNLEPIPGVRISICLDTVASDSGGLSLPPVPAYTDEQGRYELAVPYGFTGKIVPHKLGYQFEPRYREYADLQASLDGQDFTGTIRTPSETVIVAGRATLASGEGLADVSILADGLSDGPSSGSLIAIGGSAAMTRTDEQGYYSLELPLGWTGRVAAFMPWLDFLPECYEFAGLEQNVENADFIGERLRTHVIVAGQAIEPDGDGAANVLMTVSADNGTSVAPALGMPAFLTDEYGYYRIPLPLGFTGRIEPVKFGYRFDPSFRAYEDLRIDLEGEDYFALDMLSFEISGNVATAAGEPVSGVVMIASPASLGSAPGTPGDSSPGTAFVRLRAITDENGFYSLAVPEGWSGVVKPHKGLWTFEPEEREYTVVMENIAGQDYLAASPAMATLSGSVHTAEGEPIGGVILAANHARLEGEPAVALSEDPMALCVAANSAVTSDTGFYSLQVPVGWHGRVTPYKPGYSFLPPYRLYEDVAGDMADQDYIGEYNPLFVSGYVLTEEGAPVRGVLLTGSHGVGPALTNASGYYRLRVPFGRPFRVMPRKPGYAFDPVSRDYGPLAESLENENYTASARPNLPIPPALGMCEDLAGGMMRMQWANCGETPMAHLGLIWDWYGENWLAGDDGSPWRLFGGTTWEGDFGLGATGAYFAWISSYYQDGLWLPCQNPMAFMQMSGVPHTPRSFQAQNMGAGPARLQWKPDIYGAWHAQFIAYNATAGEWAVSQGPGGQGLWHFLAFPHDDFLNGQMDLGLAAGAQYWIYMRQVGWIPPYRASGFAAAFVDMSE